MGFRDAVERIRMRILPPSAKGFYAISDEMRDAFRSMGERLDALAEDNRRLYEENGRLFARIEQADYGINGNIDYKFEDRLLPRLEDAFRELAAHDAHMKLLLWEIARREGETDREAKMRIHRSLPRATGVLRLLQRGGVALLGEFVELCEAHGLEYFLSYGTLLGAVRQGGFIPWDDDLDVGMPFDDSERLAKIVEGDDRYEWSVVYDQNVYCKQIRFRYADAAVPCFIDVFIYDYTKDTACIAEAYAALRRGLVDEVKREEEENGLEGEKYLPAGDGRSKAIAEVFDRYRRRAEVEGLICPREEAAVLRYGLENMDDPASGACAFSLSDIFPMTRVRFEGVECFAPREYEKILSSCYGDWLELPKDLHTHFEHIDKSKVDADILADRFGRDE